MIDKPHNDEEKLEEDIRYINSEIIAKLKNGSYCKFSRVLNAISILQITKEQYIKYWQMLYKNDELGLKLILEACESKFNDGLTSKKEMLELLKNSNDIADEREQLKLMLK